MATSTCDETGNDAERPLYNIRVEWRQEGRRVYRSALPSFALIERKYLFARTLAICIIVRPIHEPKEMPKPPKEKNGT